MNTVYRKTSDAYLSLQVRLLVNKKQVFFSFLVISDSVPSDGIVPVWNVMTTVCQDSTYKRAAHSCYVSPHCTGLPIPAILYLRSYKYQHLYRDVGWLL